MTIIMFSEVCYELLNINGLVFNTVVLNVRGTNMVIKMTLDVLLFPVPYLYLCKRQ